MARFLTLILLVTSLAAQSAEPPASSAVPQDENSRKARALIDKAIAALGGQAYLSSKNRTEEGRFYSFYHGESRGVGTPYRDYRQFPDKERFEVIKATNKLIPIPIIGVIVVTGHAKDKEDLILIHDGDNGYEVTYKGAAKEEAKVTRAYVRRRLHSLDWVLRTWIKQPGVAFFYDGVTVAGEKAAEKVTVMNSNNDAVSVYIDQTTFLPVKTGYSFRDPDDHERSVEEELFDGYKPMQGIMTPQSVTRYMNGEMSAQRFITAVIYDRELSPDLFSVAVTYDPYKNQPFKDK
jgi:hypothetical protein